MSDSIKISGFQNIEKIVAGSYWTLFRAVSRPSGTRHLLQVLDESATKDVRLVTLFKELRATSSILHHDNILTPMDFGETDQHTFLIYEDVNATSLQMDITAGMLPAEASVVAAIRAVAEALQFAQIRGVQHGWVLPEMILRSTSDDSIKIYGFGSEKIFEHLYDKRPDIAAALNPFIPPEHLAQPQQPKPDDCYALGVTFYLALTGEAPFDAEKVVELKQQKLAAIRFDPLAHLSAATAELLAGLLHPKPFLRATYSSLLNELNPQEENVVLPDQPAYEPQARLSSFRNIWSDANPFAKNNIGGPSKIAYTSAIAVFALVLLFSIFIVARLASNDKKRMQQIYNEYLAEQRFEQNNQPSEYEWEAAESTHLNDSHFESESVERLVEPPVTVESAPETPNAPPDAPLDVSHETDPQAALQQSELVVSVSAASENVTAEIFVDGVRYGYSDTNGNCTISELLVNKTYRIRVVRDGFQRWERPVSIKDGENALEVKLLPEVEQQPSFTFAAVPFADQIKINDESVARNLPCTLQLRPGKVNVTYIDSKAEFSWRTSFALDENESSISVSPDKVGAGDVVIVLNDPIQYGYAFVRVDENEEQHTTPFRASLSAGWHRIRVFRDEFTISPADTAVFIKPGVKLTLRCKVR